jgi:SAM-dependent methyltransferase
VTANDKHDGSTRHRRTTFDEVAALYDAVRPGYPAEIYDDIRALSGVPDGGDILEIGCGTGQATLPFAQRGYRITCVELGAELAAIARRNLAAYPNVEVRVGAFETAPLPEAAYDLIISATAFHWVAPESYPKLACVLRPRGAIALFWNKHIAGAVDGGFFDRIQPIYREHVPEFAGDWKGLPSADNVPDESAALTAAGPFGPFTVRRYPWVACYDAERYVNLLNTYSDYLALPVDRRQRVYGDIARVIDHEFGGQIAMQYLAVLYVAQVRL